MRRDAGWTDSLWPPIHDIPSEGPLEQDLQTGTCVIGAGMVGLCTAYELMRDGRSVVVLDDGPIGGGETARMAGHARSVPHHLHDFVRAHGIRSSRLAVQSHVEALDWLEGLVRREGIACHWQRVPGYVVSGASEALEQEHRAAGDLGLEAEPADAPFSTGRALRLPYQARLDPTAFLAGLASTLRTGGVPIHTYTHAARVEEDGRAVVTSTGHGIRCHEIMEATHAPVFGHAGLAQQAYRTYLIAADVREAVEDALYWDTEGVHHVRMTEGGRQAIIGGADHPTGWDPDHSTTFGALEVWGHQRFHTGRTSHRWSGQVWQPRDGLGFIGRNQKTFIATGDSANGCARAALSARLLGDLVAGRNNPWRHLYDPQRTDLPVVRPWRKEGRRLLAARRRVLMPGEVRDATEIGRGHGAIMRRGIRLFACSRDEEGAVHERLAVCTHDGCIVAWNAAEKTWDCPCDGSRYERHGTVINGPANEDLGSYSSQKDDGICQHPPPERPLHAGEAVASKP